MESPFVLGSSPDEISGGLGIQGPAGAAEKIAPLAATATKREVFQPLETAYL
jgi:hypothetical protein